MNTKLRHLALDFAVFAFLASSVFAGDYEFNGGFPTPQTVQKAYEDTDLNRAIQAYRFFYPTVSGAALFKGSAQIRVKPNTVLRKLDTQPKHVGFTLNSDTPYAPLLMDLKHGPMVVEVPKGPLIVVAMDMNQRWVADMGIPGPDQGKGGKYLFLPPGYKEKVPAGYYVARSTSYRMLAGIRSLPVGGNVNTTAVCGPMVLVGLWFVDRILRGWVALGDRRPMYV